MTQKRQVLITGIGIVSPLGIGRQAFWASLMGQASGVRPLTLQYASELPLHIGAEVCDFDPKERIKPRKSLKVMSRDIQIAFAAADLAREDARLAPHAVDPERMGVVFGTDMTQGLPEDVAGAFRGCLSQGAFDFRKWGGSAMSEIHPLWMLKYLPNMPACHVAIAHDARGPNNTLTLGEVSSLLAIAEAMRIIERGQADVMFTGGTGSQLNPVALLRSCQQEVSLQNEDPATASRPFDARRTGFVNGEGACVLVLESQEHARNRQARVIGCLRGYASRFQAVRRDRPADGTAIRRVIVEALRMSEISPADLGHVNAHGLATRHDDRIEAQAIRSTLGDVPVTAPKSFFGNLGSGSGAVELAASLLAMEQGLVPVTLNYREPDPDCPIRVVRGQELTNRAPCVLALNHNATGQAAALVVTGPE